MKLIAKNWTRGAEAGSVELRENGATIAEVSYTRGGFLPAAQQLVNMLPVGDRFASTDVLEEMDFDAVHSVRGVERIDTSRWIENPIYRRV